MGGFNRFKLTVFSDILKPKMHSSKFYACETKQNKKYIDWNFQNRKIFLFNGSGITYVQNLFPNGTDIIIFLNNFKDLLRQEIVYKEVVNFC